MIKSSAYKNLVFHDIFSYPLTERELKKFAWYDEFKDNKDVTNYENQAGFYFLPNKADNIKIRNNNFVISISKLRKAKRLVGWLRLLPSVKMIAICNSLGYLNASQTSDIDLFIITDKNKIWLTRFWLQSFLKFLRLRPFDRGHKQDSFCLTFFLSQENLDISNLQINKPDIYLIYWLTKLLPIYDPDNIYYNFFTVNGWFKKYLPHAEPIQLDSNWMVKKTFLSNLFFLLTLPIWEKLFKKIQWKLLPKDLKKIANHDTRVIVNDLVLKFHGQDDKREYYQKLWQEKLTG